MFPLATSASLTDRAARPPLRHFRQGAQRSIIWLGRTEVQRPSWMGAEVLVEDLSEAVDRGSADTHENWSPGPRVAKSKESWHCQFSRLVSFLQKALLCYGLCFDGLRWGSLARLTHFPHWFDSTSVSTLYRCTDPPCLALLLSVQ